MYENVTYGPSHLLVPFHLRAVCHNGPPVRHHFDTVFLVTRHVRCQNSKILRPLDILAYNSANKPHFQNLTKSLLPNAP